MSQPNSDRVAAAARNNAAWYEAIFRAHSLPDEISSSVWLSRATPPPYHSNLVVVSPSGAEAALARIHELIRLPPCPRWTLKDSFFSLELGGLGFEVLFEAAWIWRQRGTDRSPAAPASLRWSRVGSEAELTAFEEVWAGDAQNIDAVGQPAQFPSALLADPSFAFFAAYRGQEIVAGGIANRAAGVVGLSNIFGGSGDPAAVWIGLIDAAEDAFPGLPLVGYERGAALNAAEACGFRSIGPLRVWMRRAAPTSS